MSETSEEYMKQIGCETVDDYREYLKKRFPPEDIVEIDGHPTLKSCGNCICEEICVPKEKLDGFFEVANLNDCEYQKIMGIVASVCGNYRSIELLKTEAKL